MRIAVGIIIFALFFLIGSFLKAAGIRSTIRPPTFPDLEVSTRSYNNTNYTPVIVTSHVVISGDLRIYNLFK